MPVIAGPRYACSVAVAFVLAIVGACQESPPRADQAPAAGSEQANAPTAAWGDVPWLGDRTSARRRDGIVNDTCLAMTELALDGTSVGMNASDARARLGSPQRAVEDSGMDDGGMHVVDRWYYGAVMVEIVRGRVDRVVTSSARLHTPAGLRVGLARAEVKAILESRGFEVGALTDSLDVPGCGAPNGYTVLHFGPDGRVRRLELTAARP